MGESELRHVISRDGEGRFEHDHDGEPIAWVPVEQYEENVGGQPRIRTVYRCPRCAESITEIAPATAKPTT